MYKVFLYTDDIYVHAQCEYVCMYSDKRAPCGLVSLSAEEVCTWDIHV